MNLEYLAPGARRRTHTAGTTEASLLSLLDVGNHGIRVQKGDCEVNRYLATRGHSTSTFRLPMPKDQQKLLSYFDFVLPSCDISRKEGAAFDFPGL